MLPDRMLTSSRREANTRWSSTTVKWPWPARCRTRPPTPNVQLTWRSKVNGQQSYFMLHQSRKKDLIRSWLPGSVPSVFYRLKQTGQIGRKSHFHRINGCEPQLATTVPLKSSSQAALTSHQLPPETSNKHLISSFTEFCLTGRKLGSS